MSKRGEKKFKNGCYVNHVRQAMKYIRVCAGPQRGEYMHKLIWLAYANGWVDGQTSEGRPASMAMLKKITQVRCGELTVDHINGNSLDNRPYNLEPVTDAVNTARMQERMRKARECKRLARKNLAKTKGTVTVSTSGQQWDTYDKDG